MKLIVLRKQNLLLLPHYGNVSFPITTPDFKAAAAFSAS
jgi:hypothetical protein